MNSLSELICFIQSIFQGGNALCLELYWTIGSPISCAGDATVKERSMDMETGQYFSTAGLVQNYFANDSVHVWAAKSNVLFNV